MVRRLWVLGLLAALVATAASAQARWSPEFGIQGGFSRLKPSGTHARDQIDRWDLPGFAGAPGSRGLYAVFPVTDRLALEPSLSAADFNLLFSNSTFAFGLRGNYAVTANLYAGVGGALAYASFPDTNTFEARHGTTVGLQAAVGLRVPVSGHLRVRVEASATTFHKADNIPPANFYAVLVGVSTTLPRTSARPAVGAPGPWRPGIGIVAGYARTHFVGVSFDLSTVAAPGFGASVTSIPLLGSLPTMGPATLFAIIPLSGRLAVESGLDFHRAQSGGTTRANGLASLRLDYALHGGWYVAAGGSVRYFESTTVKAGGVAGVGSAVGYRFPFTQDLGGRVEASYTMFKQHGGLGIPAASTFALLVGTTMSLR